MKSRDDKKKSAISLEMCVCVCIDIVPNYLRDPLGHLVNNNNNRSEYSRWNIFYSHETHIHLNIMLMLACECVL